MKKPKSELSFCFGSAPIPSNIEPSCLNRPEIPRPLNKVDSCMGSRVVAYGIGVWASDGLDMDDWSVSSSKDGVLHTEW